MKKSRNVLAVVAAVTGCLILVWLATSIQGGQRTYELKPQIAVPEYRTDAARAIDAYERLMDRYMDLTERNLFMVGTDIQDVVRKLDSIDGKLTQLSKRMAGIENALDIKQLSPPAIKKPSAKPLGKRPSLPAPD